jgi:hypothetical protein
MGLYWIFLVAAAVFFVYAWSTNTFESYYWTIIYALIGLTILIKIFF